MTLLLLEEEKLFALKFEAESEQYIILSSLKTNCLWSNFKLNLIKTPFDTTVILITHGVESLGDDKNVVDANSKEKKGNH